MTSVFGHSQQEGIVARAFASGKMHHGWLLTGTEGIGKATFAWAAAQHILSRHPEETEIVFAPDFTGVSGVMLEKRNHPDCLYLTLEPKNEKEHRNKEAGKDFQTRRNISVDQVRRLQRKLTIRPSLGKRRAIIIDSVDYMERSAANALLKNLEEPPENTVFFLISHNPGKLVATIRSRCFSLSFAPLCEADMRFALTDSNSSLSTNEIGFLCEIGAGSPGYALKFRDLGMESIHVLMQKISDSGDRNQRLRLQLAGLLSGKAAKRKLAAFLAYAPVFAARSCRYRTGASLAHALAAWEDIVALTDQAPTYNFTADSIAFQVGSLLARLAFPKATTS